MEEMEKLVKQTGSIFKLAILAAKRTCELNNGFKAKIDDIKGKKLATIALEEIAEGKIEFTTDAASDV
ncbi:MAG: DNA-directed RNA polymerase subunit omega [Candidatus Omnitrophica bacterium]|nr:DNA-directed RNA polymerase subunit omega [Candidatus Omnitrophota bacterium]